MKRFLGCAASIFLAVSGITFATGVDPNDSVLVAYRLTPEQSAAFNASDKAVSAFWDLISETGHDGWKLIPSTHTYLQGSATGFVNDSDAQMTVKAAYDSTGVYFYFKVLDNQWMAGEGLGGWENDIVDLYLDNRSSSGIVSDPSVFVNGFLTNTCNQYWIPIGGETSPVINGLNYWDTLLLAWTNSNLDMTTASQKTEVVILDSLNRVLEMFVPWTNFGVGGVSGLAAEGTQYAVSGGYNDLDSTSVAAKRLRILHNSDPYQTAQNTWADLELGPEIVASLSDSKSTPRLQASAFSAGKIIASDYFTIAGRKIDKPAIGSRSYRTLIRRDRMENGTVINSIIRN